MGRVKLSVVLTLICAVKCLAMSYNELEEFSDYLKKTSQLSPTLKKGVSPDDYDDDEVVSDHAWEESGKFEGDLILNERQRRLIVENIAEGLSRNGIRDGAKRWPNNEVIVYIQVEHFTNDQVQAILNGIDDIARASCIKFRRYRKGDRDAVVIQGNRRGCFSQVGYQGGYQVLNLSGRHPVGRGCFRHGTVVHEMLHTLGFYHMQSSPDRDDYVDIIWENIVQPARHNFRKYNSFSVSDFGVGYDYDSVLHYSRRAFSSNGQDTIVPKKRGADIGQRIGLSDKDTQKLNKMYCDADSDHIIADEDTTKKNKKKNKNKPFDGHGIGYHQGKAVVIKLLPAPETHKLIDEPSSDSFDYFSKPPQILSTSENENFRVGKEVTNSYNPSAPMVTLYNREPVVYSAEPKSQSYERESDFHNQDHNYDSISEDKNINHGNLKNSSDTENNDDSTKETPRARSVDVNNHNPDLIEAIDRLSHIIKSHVYPSQTPDLSIYKTYENKPSGNKEVDESIQLAPIIDPIFQKEKTESAVRYINNLYDLNSHQSFKVIEDRSHPKPKIKDYHRYKPQSNSQTQLLEATTPGNGDKNTKYKYPSYHISFSEHDQFDDEHKTLSPFAALKQYQGVEEYPKYSSKISDEEKSLENQGEWPQSYVPYKYKPDRYESDSYTGFVGQNLEGDVHDLDYNSSGPTKKKDYLYHAPFRSDKYNDESNEKDR